MKCADCYVGGGTGRGCGDQGITGLRLAEVQSCVSGLNPNRHYFCSVSATAPQPEVRFSRRLTTPPSHVAAQLPRRFFTCSRLSLFPPYGLSPRVWNLQNWLFQAIFRIFLTGGNYDQSLVLKPLLGRHKQHISALMTQKVFTNRVTLANKFKVSVVRFASIVCSCMKEYPFYSSKRDWSERSMSLLRKLAIKMFAP